MVTPKAILPLQRDSKRSAAEAADRAPSARTRGGAVGIVPWLSFRSTLAQALLAGGLLWAALPPLDQGWLAWAAPAGWVLLARRKELAARRPYLALWVAGLAFWLTTLHWLTLPHWATSFGWLALSAYLACYLPIFVGLTRVAVHRLRVPVIIAAPVVWTGLELARGHLLTGFTMASLGHTQWHWIEVIQISDLAGAYGVSFVVMLVAACLARMLPCDGRRWTAWPLAPAAAMMAAALVYGHFRQMDEPAPSAARVALIQCSFDTQFDGDPNRGRELFKGYFKLTQRAIAEHKDLDLVVWPETMYGRALIAAEPALAERASFDPAAREVVEAARRSEAEATEIARVLAGGPEGPAWLVGIEAYSYGLSGISRFNSALFIEPDGSVQGRYDKMHPVMFGEYVPLGETFPWLYRLTPMSGGLDAGEEARSFRLGSLRLSPSVCYETVVPHLIRRQINELRTSGEAVNVLVNLTNDGWFWGSAELDMHLACGVFRAVECRMPLLIAANTGFSAWIDGDGRIRAQGPRHAEGIVLAEVSPDPRESGYLRWGDLPAGLCLAACVVFAMAGLRRRFHRS
jgi:apolipoprotein N-acyltransferase